MAFARSSLSVLCSDEVSYACAFVATPSPLLLPLQEHNGLRKAIIELVALRRKWRIHARSTVNIRKATADVYAATIDDKIAVKVSGGVLGLLFAK